MPVQTPSAVVNGGVSISGIGPQAEANRGQDKRPQRIGINQEISESWTDGK